MVVFLLAAVPQIQAGAQEQPQVYVIEADGLACPFCAYGIEKQLSAIEGVKSVETDIRSGTVIVTMQDTATLSEQSARRAVEAAGFTMRDFSRQGTRE